jgi:hypothetical protein
MDNPIIVLQYDPRWPALFQSLRGRIAYALDEMAAAIEHVGSTAVPGLVAKPIIDIDVLLASETMLPAAIERLRAWVISIAETWASPSARLSVRPAAILRITFTFAHRAAPSFKGMWRSETTSALTDRTPKSTVT